MQISTIRKKWYDSYLLQKVQPEQRSAVSFQISTFHLSLKTEQRVEQQGVTAALSCHRAFQSLHAPQAGAARQRERDRERNGGGGTRDWPPLSLPIQPSPGVSDLIGAAWLIPFSAWASAHRSGCCWLSWGAGSWLRRHWARFSNPRIPAWWWDRRTGLSPDSVEEGG